MNTTVITRMSACYYECQHHQWENVCIHTRSSYNSDDDECLHVIMNVNGTREKMYAHLSNTQVLDSANMNHLHSHFYYEFCQCWDREEIHVHQGWVYIQNNPFHETLQDENKDCWGCSLLHIFYRGHLHKQSVRKCMQRIFFGHVWSVFAKITSSWWPFSHRSGEYAKIHISS